MTYYQIFSGIAAATTFFVAFTVLRRDPSSFVHRIAAIGLTIFAVEAVVLSLSPITGSAELVLFWQKISFFVASFIPGIWVVFSLAFARTNYEEILWKRLWFVVGTFLMPFLLTIVFRSFFFAPEPVVTGINGLVIRLGWSGYAFQLVFLLSSVFILMNLEKTLRTSAGRVRWQIKFVVIGVGSLFASRIYFSSQALLFHLIEPVNLVFNAGALIIMDLCLLRAFKRSPVLDVDFYVSTAFLYNSLTILFVGLYLIGVGVVARLGIYFEFAEGATFRFFYIFVAFLGLAIFLLSDRFRRKLKGILVRHFKRPYYDYRKEWAAFTESTANVTNIADLCSVVARVVSKTFDALSVTIWLTDEAGEGIVMAGSTVFAEGKFQKLREVEGIVFRVVQNSIAAGYPMDYDYWTDIGRKIGEGSDNFYEQTRIQHIIPLSAAGKTLGVLTVGERVGRNDYFFTAEDFDLLKTMADQAAANIYNLMLGERLRKAREIEAFQEMSAFFVHDLKNVASKLSLTMQNLPTHFDNPEFRADAIRSFSQSLAKINGMCTRLSALSQRLELNKTPDDLNQVISEVVNEMETTIGNKTIKFEPRPLPRIRFDTEQFQKVLVNLLLNAREATADGGHIKVETVSRDKWVECSVTDNGCGISPEFIKNSLFRPFRTTKNQGMGIGLYHSKAIIEAHDGKIEVESEEGRGTVFRVLLPG